MRLEVMVRSTGSVSRQASVAPGQELVFGRSTECDLPIPANKAFSRTHGRFYFAGGGWRVRREGSSSLRLWCDFGVPGRPTCHGLGSDLQLPVTEGAIMFRPPAEPDVRLEWALTEMGISLKAFESGISDDITRTALGEAQLPVEGLTPRFTAFLLVLCHRYLLKLDYAAPSLSELALWTSGRRGKPLSVETLRTEYTSKLRSMLNNMVGTRTHARISTTEFGKHHADHALLAQDVVDAGWINVDGLIEHIRAGYLPNFPDLGWQGGRRG